MTRVMGVGLDRGANFFYTLWIACRNEKTLTLIAEEVAAEPPEVTEPVEEKKPKKYEPFYAKFVREKRGRRW